MTDYYSSMTSSETIFLLTSQNVSMTTVAMTTLTSLLFTSPPATTTVAVAAAAITYSDVMTGLNTTLPPPPYVPVMTRAIKTAVLTAMFVVSLVGNTVVFMRTFRMRRRKRPIDTLILHLSTADLIVTCFCNVTEAIWQATVQWYGSDGLCRLLKFLQVFGLYLSTYVITAIAVDRCLAILDPMNRNKAPFRVKVMMIAAWTLSVFFSLPQLYIFRVMRGPFSEDFYQCVTHGAYTAHWQRQLYSIFSLAYAFVIPLAIMVTSYTLILCTIAKKSRDFQDDFETSDISSMSRDISQPIRGRLYQRAKVKSLRISALIVAAFIVCWSPYYVLYIVTTFFEDRPSEAQVRAMTPEQLDDTRRRAELMTAAGTWIFFFGMANSMVNPLIYSACHFRQTQAKKSASPVRFRARPVRSPGSSFAYKRQQSLSSRERQRLEALHGAGGSLPLRVVTAGDIGDKDALGYYRSTGGGSTDKSHLTSLPLHVTIGGKWPTR